MRPNLFLVLSAALLGAALGGPAAGQTPGSLRGTITLEATGAPLHRATVTIVQLRRSAESNDEGVYEIPEVPPGSYDVSVHMEALTDERQRVEITAGAAATADFRLRLSPIREQVTVTASGREQTTFDAFQTVTSLDSLQLTQLSQPSLGEVLDQQPGVAKRSFGPGTARPVIRGFDGDRVLVLQDGMPSGTLSSQSGDHGEIIDAAGLERLEVVKGPATLLYGSNAIGGAVHAVSRHHEFHEHPHEGLSGFFSGVGGSANAQGGGSGGFEYGIKNWLLWGSGGGQRTGSYHTPAGEVPNSETRTSHGSGGFGHYSQHSFVSLGYGYQDGRYGVPPAGPEGEQVDLTLRRHDVRFSAGLRNLGGFVESFRLSTDYSDYQHRELSGEEVGTVFNNKLFNYRGVFQQHQKGRVTGSFGFSGMHRDYEAIGEESLSPPVKQDSFALFGLEEVGFERVRFQFGGRVEQNRYDPTGLASRTFTGFSGSAGLHLSLWRGGAFVANYTHSYRAPALEELYNHGPHPGNQTFEIGDSRLRRERGDGVEFSLRHSASRLRAEVNFFRHDLRDFVYLAPTGEFEEGLRVADYAQGDARFTGGEANLDVSLHPNLWLNLGGDYVNAKLKETGTPLPRIPPLRGRIGVDARYKGFGLKPQVTLANAQHLIFSTETRTAGYAVIQVTGSYTIAQQHTVQVLSLEVFNAGNRLYRNHLSFIKDFAPEIGRGVRFTYTLRFF